MNRQKILAGSSIIAVAIWGTSLKVVADEQSPTVENNGGDELCHTEPSARRREAGFVDECGGGASRGSFNRGSFSRGSFNRGSFNRGSFNRGSFNRGSFSRGSFNRGSFNRGSFNRGSFSRGSFNRGSFNRGSFNRGSFNRGSKRAADEDVTAQQEIKPEPLKLPKIIAPLVPLHTGLTVTEQPTLYWYMSYPWDGYLWFTLNEVGGSEPILEPAIDFPSDRDKHTQDDFMYHLRLADYGVRLKPEQEYEWFLFIVMNPEQRTSDWLASGTIRYIEPSKRLGERLNKTPLEKQYKVYKKEGVWYDAIANLSMQIEKQPNNKALRKVRATWMKDEKMPKVAKYDSDFPSPCIKCYYPVN